MNPAPRSRRDASLARVARRRLPRLAEIGRRRRRETDGKAPSARVAADDAEAAAGARALPPTTVILSHHDNIVAPQASQSLPHAARTHELGGIGHLSLAYDRTVWTLLAEALSHRAGPGG